MAPKLAAQVVLIGDDGEPVTYAANTRPPADIAKQITNPAAWLPDEEGGDPDPEPTKRPAKKTAAKKAAAKAPADNAAAGTPAPDGAGSDAAAPADDAGDEAWRAYAATVGVTVADDADTAAVKAELDGRGLLEQ